MALDYQPDSKRVRELQIQPGEAIHVATRELVVTPGVVGQQVQQKPKGLWYACGREWLNWLEYQAPAEWRKFVHLYRLRLDYQRMLVLRTQGQLRAFNATFGRTRYEDLSFVAWDEVAKLYMGIEICPHQWELRLKEEFGWYYTWDVAGGCVWDSRAVLGVERLL